MSCVASGGEQPLAVCGRGGKIKPKECKPTALSVCGEVFYKA